VKHGEGLFQVRLHTRARKARNREMCFTVLHSFTSPPSAVAGDGKETGPFPPTARRGQRRPAAAPGKRGDDMTVPHWHRRFIRRHVRRCTAVDKRRAREQRLRGQVAVLKVLMQRLEATPVVSADDDDWRAEELA